MDPYSQSAVIPVRREAAGIRVLLITSFSGRRWVIPKGIIEEGMTPEESARKEAHDEAGISGRIPPDLLGAYAYRKWGGTCRVRVYLMAVEEILDTWPEAAERRREWVAPEEAARRVREPALAAMLLDIEATCLRLGIP